MDRYVFAVAFYLLSSSIVLVFLTLNQLITKIFNRDFSQSMLMMGYVTGTSIAFIVSQTFYFSNIVGWIAPDEVLYQPHMGRVLSLSLLSFCVSMAIVFSSSYRKNLWKWVIGGLVLISCAMFIFEPYIVAYK